MADGGNFVVPPRFINDSMPVMLDAGEGVSVTSRQDMQRNEREGNQGGNNVQGMFDGATIVINNGMDLEQFMAFQREALQ